MNTTAKIPVVIYAESTPNPSAMKFVSNKILLETLSPMEFMSAAEAKSSPLAIEIFNFPFVKSVFISGNYITITKSESIEWSEVLLETREFLRIYLSEGKPVVTRENAGVQRDPLRNDMPEEFSIDHSIPQTETEKKIVGILEQYVTPAVGQDGGMIVFRSFSDGIVSLQMRGACSGCPSSTATLKTGIEALLKKFVPEVKEVVSV